MGQAKHRGTFAERQAQALQRSAAKLAPPTLAERQAAEDAADDRRYARRRSPTPLLVAGLLCWPLSLHR